MTKRENIEAIAKRWMEEIWRERNLENFDEIQAQNFVDSGAEKRASDRESYRQSVIELFVAFPDWKADIEDILVDESKNKAVIRWTGTGSHQNEYLGFTPSKRLIKFQGIEIIEIKEDQIIERWGEWNGISILEQIHSR